jgi:hypothetical protein
VVAHYGILKAFGRISQPVLHQLSLPLNYPLLLSILRSHFTRGVYFNLGSVLPEGQAFVLPSIEGYPITFNGTKIDTQYYKAKLSSFATADNGVIQKIDRLLDPYASTFGVSATKGSGKATVIDNSVRQEDKTMTDLVRAEPLLASWRTLMEEVLPQIMKRLGDRRGAEGKDCKTPFPFVVLPVNDAFSQLPANYTKSLKAPYNFGLSNHLLAWGISVPTCATFQDILATVKEKGSFQIFSHRADMNLTVSETVKGSGELTVNNARVITANRCAGNGCIWMVDRMIDPVYGLF